MKITIDNREYELKYSFRTLMVYENITNKSFEPKSLTDIINLFYSCIIVNDLTKGNTTITYDNFLDWLEKNPVVLTEFSNWLLDIFNTNNLATKEPENIENDNTVKKKIKS